MLSYYLHQPAGRQLALAEGRVYRPNFVSQLTSAAKSLNVQLAWLSDNYVAVVKDVHSEIVIVGYKFPLNSAAASYIADDKVATAEVLAYAGVPYVHHALIRFNGPKGLAREVKQVTQLWPFPLVVKPCRGSGGQDVIRADAEGSLTRALIALQARHHALAVSPWLDIKQEYRVIILDRRVQLIFEKVRAVPEGTTKRISRAGMVWQHNLRCGSVPVIHVVGDTCNKLSKIALCAMDAVGLHFAAVDVVATSAGLAVLEINSGVSLERFSTFGSEHFGQACQVYLRALAACLA